MKHAQSYLTALLSLVLAYAIGGAHAEEQSIELGLPKNPIYAGKVTKRHLRRGRPADTSLSS